MTFYKKSAFAILIIASVLGSSFSAQAFSAKEVAEVSSDIKIQETQSVATEVFVVDTVNTDIKEKSDTPENTTLTKTNPTPVPSPKPNTPTTSASCASYQYITQWGTNGSGNGQFDHPFGITTDSNGNVYVADTFNDRIQKFTSNGTYITQWGTNGSGNGQFLRPNDITVDPSSNNVYVADNWNSRVQKFTSSGAFITEWWGLGQVQDVAVDSLTDVYGIDYVNNKIKKFTSSGAFITEWGTNGSGNGQFNWMSGIATDSLNNIYVADALNYRIQKFTSNGTYVTQWGGLPQPTDVATDSLGDVYVLDVGNSGKIKKFTSNGALITQWATQGSGNGQLSGGAESLTIDLSGNVYVADTYNNRIQKFGCTQQTPEITVISPNGGETYQTEQQITVDWTSQNIPSTENVNITITSDQPPLGGLTPVVVPNTGSAQYTLPDAATLAAMGWSLGTHFKISVTHYLPGTPPIVDASDLSDNLFTIDQATSVILTSPNGGEVYHQVQPLTVTWTSTGYSSSSLANIDLGVCDINWNCNNTFLMRVMGTANDGTETFTIPANVPNSNNYIFYISTYEPGGGNPNFDLSDGMFTITASTSCNSYDYITQWGTLGNNNGQFARPYDVTTDSSGNIYVADTENNRIQKFTSTGTYVTGWGVSGNGNGQFNRPYGIATDSSGNVYVSDTYNHRIQKFTSNGTYITKWGNFGTGNGQFRYQAAIAIDSTDDVYVVDPTNNRVQKFTSNGTYITKWGTQGSGDGQFSGPYGLGTDSAGNVYVADTGNNRVQKFTSGGTYITKWGTQGNSDGQFLYPLDVTTDSAGNVYVADKNNDRVQKFGCQTIPPPSTEKVYLIGGLDPWLSDFNDVWSSTDMTSWSQLAVNDPNTTSRWSPRFLFNSVAYFNNKLWVLGNKDTGYLSNDIWSSPDGITWTNDGTAAWSQRAGHGVTVFNNKIWVLGGYYYDGTDYQHLNDVWSSPDGINWTQEVANAPWAKRSHSTVITFNNKMWVISGGVNQLTGFSDVWSSPDGINWTEENPNAFSPRQYQAGGVFNGKMWISGGFNTSTGYLDDVLSSSDGINWTTTNPHAPWGPRSGHSMIAFNNKLWLLAGWEDGVSSAQNDIWSSSDGINWIEEVANAPWLKRLYQAVVVTP